MNVKAAKHPSPPRQRSLYQQIRAARFWIPLTIVGVVIVQESLIVPLGGAEWRFWSQLLFYSLLGPSAVFLILNWIASEVRQREVAQNDLRQLYTELQASHALLSAIQKVTERFATATDLETVLAAASQGVSEATQAEGAAIILGGGNLGVTHSYGLTPALCTDAAARDRLLAEGKAPEGSSADQSCWVLSLPLVWGGTFAGSIHGYYRQPPSAEQRESFSILSAEFSAAAEANRARTRDLLTLFEVDRSIRAEGNLERLLETLLNQVTRRAEASLGGVYLADEEGMLRLKARCGLEGEPLPASLHSGEGFVGKSASVAEPRISPQLTSTERVSPILARAQSAVSLPLVTEVGLLGVIVLAHEEPNHFAPASLPFLSLLAGQVSLAVHNARAYLQSEELAIAEERARIAREIHDGVAQMLAFTALKLDLVTRLSSQPQKAATELDKAKRTIRETIKEVRRSIFALRPVDLERYGFTETLRRYGSDYGQQNDIRVEVEVCQPPQLTLKSEVVLFRIFQEAMNNIAKHAAAGCIRVTVDAHEGRGFVTIEDDGMGFDLEAISERVSSTSGLGLKQMRERVEGRGGCFEVTSAPGRGTRVFASVPE